MHGKMEEIAKSLEEITFLMDDYRVLNSSSKRMPVLMEMLKETEKIFFAISSQLYKESEVENK